MRYSAHELPESQALISPGSELLLRANNNKAVCPSCAEGSTVQLSCCRIEKSDPIDGMGPVATDASSKCDGDIEHIPFHTREKRARKGASICKTS